MKTYQKFKVEDYMSDIFGKFNYVNGIADDLQGTYTCDATVQKIIKKLSKIKNIHNCKVLVMYNVEIAAALLKIGLKQSQITVYNNSSFKNNELIKSGFKTIFESKFNKNKTIMKAYAKHFDVVLGNPPYKKRMHLDFLDNGYDLLKEDGKMIFVHPTNWLLHLRENSNFKTDSKLKEKIGTHFVSFDFYNFQDLFPTEKGTYYPIAITHIDKTKTSSKIEFNRFDKINESYIVNDPRDVNHIGSYTLIKSIETKIKNKVSSFISDVINNNVEESHYVSLNWMGGTGYLSTTFTDGITRKFENRYNFINSLNNFVSKKPLRSESRGGKKAGNLRLVFHFIQLKKQKPFYYMLF